MNDGEPKRPDAERPASTDAEEGARGVPRVDVFYRQCFEEMPCYVSVQDRDLRIIKTNRRFIEDFGDGVGRPCYEVYKHRTERCLECPVALTFEDGETHHSEEVVTSKSGRRTNVLVYTSPIRDERGEVVSVVEMSTDITMIRQLQDQLTSLGLLVSSISHGIKGLLTGLRGGIYMLKSGHDKGDEDRVRRGWTMVEGNETRLRNMVHDVLYYAKEREFCMAPMDAGALAEDVCEGLRARAVSLGVGLEYEAGEDAGSFMGDCDAMHSALVNLLENSLDACRVARKDRPHAAAVSVKGDAESVVFEISDNGIGMDRETREKAFSLFFSSKGTEGTGLGLFIANKIVAKHGGSIKIESEPDRGTRFLVKLPRKSTVSDIS